MIKVLFICHGNICRSTMAQYVFQNLIDRHNLTDQFYIDSAATSREEIGNPIHHGTRRKLKKSAFHAVITAHASCKSGNMTNLII